MVARLPSLALVALLAVSCQSSGTSSSTAATQPTGSLAAPFPTCVPTAATQALPSSFPPELTLYPGSVVIRVNEEARFSTVLAMTRAGFKDVLVSYRRAVDAGGFQLLNDEVDPSDGELLVQKATQRISIQVKGTSCEQETSAYAITWASLPKPAS